MTNERREALRREFNANAEALDSEWGTDEERRTASRRNWDIVQELARPV